MTISFKRRFTEFRRVARPAALGVDAEPASESEPAPVVSDPRVERFTALADALTRTIEEKSRPLSQNPTPKRMKEYRMRLWEAGNLERVQRALLALASCIRSGNLPPILQDIRSKKDIEPLVHKGLLGNGGYYDVLPDPEYRDKSLKARSLQQLVEQWGGIEAAIQRQEAEKRRKIQDMEDKLRFAQIDGFFPTPERIINQMVSVACIPPHARVLEPSAGKGDIADAIRDGRPDVNIHCIELRPALCEILMAKGYQWVQEMDFLEYNPVADCHYDSIVMNPPFEHGQDAEHVLHAWSMLKPGGRLVAIVSVGPFFREDAKSKAFRDWWKANNVEIHPLPGDWCSGPGAFRSTGVRAKIVVAQKP